MRNTSFTHSQLNTHCLQKHSLKLFLQHIAHCYSEEFYSKIASPEIQRWKEIYRETQQEPEAVEQLILFIVYWIWEEKEEGGEERVRSGGNWVVVSSGLIPVPSSGLSLWFLTFTDLAFPSQWNRRVLTCFLQIMSMELYLSSCRRTLDNEFILQVIDSESISKDATTCM